MVMPIIKQKVTVVVLMMMMMKRVVVVRKNTNIKLSVFMTRFNFMELVHVYVTYSISKKIKVLDIVTYFFYLIINFQRSDG